MPIDKYLKYKGSSMLVSDIIGFQYLTETPQIVGDENWGLTSADENEMLRRKLVIGGGKGVEKLGTHNGVDLYLYRKNAFAIDPSKKQLNLVYWSRVEVQDEKLLVGTKSVTQRAVWRNTDWMPANKMAAYVFFNVWLKKYGCIATDKLQTADGKRFWTARIPEAFDKDLHVYVLDETNKKLIKLIDVNELAELQDRGIVWGSTKESQMKRVLISTKILTPAAGVTLED